jgi:hypothetical protein
LETDATVLIEKDFETHGHDNNSGNSLTMGEPGEVTLRVFDVQLSHKGGVKIKDSELVREIELTVEKEIDCGAYDEE